MANIGSHTSVTRSRSPNPQRRPKLYRSSATAPSLATSTASRRDLASRYPSSGASAILARLACSSQRSRSSSRRDSEAADSLHKIDALIHRPLLRHTASSTDAADATQKKRDGQRLSVCQAGNYVDAGLAEYFSFPNFEDFEEPHESAVEAGAAGRR